MNVKLNNKIMLTIYILPYQYVADSVKFVGWNLTKSAANRVPRSGVHVSALSTVACVLAFLPSNYFYKISFIALLKECFCKVTLIADVESC